MSSIGKTVSLCLLFIALVVGMFVYSVTRTPQLTDEEMRNRGVFILPTPRQLAEFELRDHNGEVFNNDSLKGKWTFMFFGFTFCPDVCPTSMAVLGQVDRELNSAQATDATLAERFQGVLVTVDPERDSAEKLGQYATAFSPRFLGVRGEREPTAQLAQQLNVSFAKVPDDNGGYTMDHTGYFVILNPYGHYHGFVKLPHKADTIRLSYQTLAQTM